MGWIRGSRQKENVECEPISLKVRDKNERLNVTYLTSNMVLELQLLLFNFSDVAYGINSTKGIRLNQCIRFIEHHNFRIERLVVDESSDTSCLVLSKADCIVIAFKGTTSMANMKTDLKVLLVEMSSAIPSRNSRDIKHEIIGSIDWKNAKIHKGFLDAYQSVSHAIIGKLKELLAIKKRPLYITGHSLGGALAAVCSVDIVLSLGVTNLCVTTFGSPKCGNLFLQRICDHLVPAYWRIAMRSDLISTLPRMGYHHSGKRVALTTSGEMFLDPNAIETLVWSSTVLGLSDHAKPAYQEALLLFCSKYLPLFKPEFLSSNDETEKESNSLSEADVRTMTEQIRSITAFVGEK